MKSSLALLIGCLMLWVGWPYLTPYLRTDHPIQTEAPRQQIQRQSYKQEHQEQTWAQKRSEEVAELIDARKRSWHSNRDQMIRNGGLDPHKPMPANQQGVCTSGIHYQYAAFYGSPLTDQIVPWFVWDCNGHWTNPCELCSVVILYKDGHPYPPNSPPPPVGGNSNNVFHKDWSLACGQTGVETGATCPLPQLPNGNYTARVTIWGAWWQDWTTTTPILAEDSISFVIAN